jgi:predicted RNase H-like nuclease (RuvC/YqgF family)
VIVRIGFGTQKEGGGEKVVSDEQTRRMIDEIKKLEREITNLKSKVRKRIKKLEKTSDPLERQRIEFEIELLKRNIRRWEIVEIKLSLPLIKAISVGKSEDGIDWSKAGKA